MNQKLALSEPLYPSVQPFAWEIELFSSKPLRRLKQLAHFGGGSFVSPVVHSRFEHTVGVWKLTALFFPEDVELRVAALLHDVGHLPFSHAVEDTLGFNHHQLTEQYILEDEISTILAKANIKPKQIIKLLNEPTSITGKDTILGIDHLDSFLRDTYMSGNIEFLPAEVLAKLTCGPAGIETDRETGNYLMKLIKDDHRLFLSPFMVAVDRLLAEAIKEHWQTNAMNKSDFARLIDADVIWMLQHSSSSKAKELINTILYQPERISVQEANHGKGYPINIRKIYSKVPLCDGKPLTEQSNEARKILEEMASLAFDLEVVVEH
ncbi:HD domain-containing protein [Gracilibacillus sp. S3-1-1]|uniref:HD domain-containing protein n=1 Tax=Gracilibacillus pellucidus TaxID=3095368 RepID=A0ACC6M0G9_9BACI|nr:HD domain-containing protein [Gracilibacillus sp. S3-1-1]MDX8044439.1 HD domain-containing protein [Gracilibacillus sp. S3-1-1]